MKPIALYLKTRKVLEKRAQIGVTLTEDAWLHALASIGHAAKDRLEERLHITATPLNPKVAKRVKDLRKLIIDAENEIRHLERPPKSDGHPIKLPVLHMNGDLKDGIRASHFGTSTEVVAWANSHGIILKKKSLWWFLVRPESSAKPPTAPVLPVPASKGEKAQHAKDMIKFNEAMARHLKNIQESPLKTGYIQGLEATTRGWPRITNGIDVWIERYDGTLFLGHKDSLIWDKRARNLEPAPSKEPKAPKVKANGIYMETANKIIANGTLAHFASKWQAQFGTELTARTPNAIADALQKYITATNVV